MRITIKPRPRARLELISPEQRAQLMVWLRENLPYKRVVVLLREQLGVQTNPTSLREFYNRHVEEILGRKPEGAVVAAPAFAGGLSLKITCHQPGEIKLAVHPLQSGEGSAPQPCVGGVQVVAVCQDEGEIKLAVFPMPAPEPRTK